MPDILVVDDENNISTLVATVLTDAGLQVATAASSKEALSAVETRQPDLIIMDVMLGDHDGFETLRVLRARGFKMPTLFLTARDTIADKITGLEIGDDYLTKPFSIDELVARVRSLLRRSGASGSAILACGDLTMNEDTFEVYRAGELVPLTPTEFRLLRTLMRNADRVVTRAQILDAVWEYERGNRASVDTYISYLRKKLDNDDGESRITTVRGHGYTINVRP
jgi:two-component system, OmpR family, response regulator